MGKAYSMDLRQRVFDYIVAGHSCRAAARVFGVSPSTAVRLASGFRDLASIAPKLQGRAPGTAGKLALHVVFLTEIVAAEPDITLRELSGALIETHGLRVDLSSIHRALVRAGLSYKKRPNRGGTATRRPATGPAGVNRHPILTPYRHPNLTPLAYLSSGPEPTELVRE